MAGYTLSALEADIRNYTEVDSTVFTGALLTRFIENAEFRINNDLPMDSDRFVDEGTMAADVDNIRVPAGTLFVRGVEVFNASNSTEKGTWLQKRDQTFLSEYVGRLTGPEGSTTSGADVTGKPKYYAMFGGATGFSDTTSGTIMFAPCPDKTYTFQVNYVAIPGSLINNISGTYLSKNFANGLLYASLVEAFGYLKGPQDMLTYYEQRYNKEVEKFAIEQVGRRRRDDYDDGTIRIKIDSPSP